MEIIENSRSKTFFIRSIILVLVFDFSQMELDRHLTMLYTSTVFYFTFLRYCNVLFTIENYTLYFVFTSQYLILLRLT